MNALDRWIVLSHDVRIREFLKKKLAQYVQRMFDLHLTESDRLSAYYKAGLVTMLFGAGEGEIAYTIEHLALRKLQTGTYALDAGSKFDEKAFDEAWKVIDDYNRTGGRFTIQADLIKI